jgi:hypothetical protein
MKKKPNNSHSSAALLLGISVEKLDELIDCQLTLSVCKHEKEQIADMYKSLYDRFDKIESELKTVKHCGDRLGTRCLEMFISGMSDDELLIRYNAWRDLVHGEPNFSGKPGPKK